MEVRMKKIGFVTPWFGENIPGGAEALLRGVAVHLYEAGVNIEILTTCAKEFLSDWGADFYAEGVYTECGLTVRRFKVDHRDCEAFDLVNAKLMRGMKISPDEEAVFVDHMINSTNLYIYLKEHSDDYALYVFIPYMFGTTYHGCMVCPEKSVLIPCFHDESYVYLNLFKKAFSQVAGMLFNAKAEARLAEELFSTGNMAAEIIGVGINTDIRFDASRFSAKYKITSPFVLYMGRKDTGKNVDVLLRYFAEYKKRQHTDLKLVLTGGGTIGIPESVKKDVHDLGFISMEDKYDACAAAKVLCQPSSFESFSIVIMESWLCGRPVLVNAKCDVTKDFAAEANAGLYYDNYFEFEGCLNYILQNREAADEMGANGRNFVLNNYTWDVVTDKYKRFFEKVSEARE